MRASILLRKFMTQMLHPLVTLTAADSGSLIESSEWKCVTRSIASAELSDAARTVISISDITASSKSSPVPYFATPKRDMIMNCSAGVTTNRLVPFLYASTSLAVPPGTSPQTISSVSSACRKHAAVSARTPLLSRNCKSRSPHLSVRMTFSTLMLSRANSADPSVLNAFSRR